MSNKVRVRIAPSPTGDPHIGTAYTALFNWAFARKHQGKFILRIEDTDRARLVKGSEEEIYKALKWLKLDFDEGPYHQSERKEIHTRYAFDLVKKGGAYFCFCSKERLDKVRGEQQKRGEIPRYDRFCLRLTESEIEKNLSEKRSYVIRLKVPEIGQTAFNDIIRGEIVFQNNDIDDQVLLKSDGFPTYHLAAVVDDHLMNITHVIRGEEWLSSTPKHVILYQYFGWNIPYFAHLSLLRNPDKSKMSKRKNPTSIFWYKNQGYLREALLNFFALMGWSHPGQKEIFSLDEFVEKFTLERIIPAGPVFNFEKLDWMNGEYIRAKSNEEIATLLKDFYPDSWDKEKVKQVIPLVKERIKKLSEFKDYVDFLFEEINLSPETLVQKGKTRKDSKVILEKALTLLQNKASWKHESLEESLRDFASREGWKPTDLFMTLRVATTGKTATPPLFETMAVLGRDKSLERISQSIKLLN